MEGVSYAAGRPCAVQAKGKPQDFYLHSSVPGSRVLSEENDLGCLQVSRSDAPASAGTAPVPLWLLGEWAAHLETPALQLWGTSRELGPEEPGQGLSCGDKEAVTALICGQKEGDNRLEGLVDLEVFFNFLKIEAPPLQLLRLLLREQMSSTYGRW
ncbi:Mastermind-like protein 2 [Manis javanica]|nr:Mastermind-like protein 2 [Manis javanica]